MTWRVESSGVMSQSSAGSSTAGKWLENLLYNKGSQFQTASTSSVAAVWADTFTNGTTQHYCLINE